MAFGRGHVGFEVEEASIGYVINDTIRTGVIHSG